MDHKNKSREPMADLPSTVIEDILKKNTIEPWWLKKTTTRES